MHINECVEQFSQPSAVPRQGDREPKRSGEIPVDFCHQTQRIAVERIAVSVSMSKYAILTGLMRCPAFKPFLACPSTAPLAQRAPRLRGASGRTAAWYFPSSVCGFSAPSAEKPHTNNIKYRGSRAASRGCRRLEI